MKTILILGNDKLGSKALELMSANDDVNVLIDRSTNYKRILRLLRKGILTIGLILKMFFAEYFRKGSKPSKSLAGISQNSELLRIINELKPDRLLLFRAGLIINKSILDTGLPILNIHAARVPDYGGLGSISKALKDKAFEQFASLHEVTDRIDRGKLIDTEKYNLNPKVSYSENEKIAYNAALKLLQRNLNIN